MSSFDVLIAGAGPAGCATALSLAAFAPELRVGLIDASYDRDDAAVGECVPPLIRPVLIHLRLWDGFLTDGHRASYRTQAAWGEPGLGSNEFLYHTHQSGWRLDRRIFDRMLKRAALEQVHDFRAARVIDVRRVGEGWHVMLADGTALPARLIVDATGRSAALARRCRLNRITLDRLTACIIQTGSRTDGTEGLIVESGESGWWYTSVLPGGRRVLGCMTDADLVKPLELADIHGFKQLLSRTRHVKNLVAFDNLTAPPVPRVVPTGSRYFQHVTALPLLCVGDAALRHDPICGLGILQALRSGVFASYAIGDYLLRGDRRGVNRYHLMQKQEFSAYQEGLRDYYSQERCWHDRPFWQRRHTQNYSQGVSHAST